MKELKNKIILDTDIGDDIDDAFALALAINSNEIDLLGVTTVFRNSKKRALIAKKLINSLGANHKVYAGIDDPLIQIPHTIIPETIKQKEKLDEIGLYLPPQYIEDMKDETIEKQSAIDFIIESIHRYPNEVTLAPIGPLTNIAICLRKDPSIIPLIKRIVLMGGYDSNQYPEWNILCDPEAARIVFTSGVKVETVGLDVTLQCGLNQKDLDMLANNQQNTSKLIQTMMNMWFKHYEFKTPVMHDPLVIAYIIDKGLLKFDLKNVIVDLNEQRGSTLSISEKTPFSSEIYVAKSVNELEFKKLFIKRLFNI